MLNSPIELTLISIEDSLTEPPVYRFIRLIWSKFFRIHRTELQFGLQYFRLTLVPPTKSQKNFEKYFCVSFVKCLVNYPWAFNTSLYQSLRFSPPSKYTLMSLISRVISKKLYENYFSIGTGLIYLFLSDNLISDILQQFNYSIHCIDWIMKGIFFGYTSIIWNVVFVFSQNNDWSITLQTFFILFEYSNHNITKRNSFNLAMNSNLPQKIVLGNLWMCSVFRITKWFGISIPFRTICCLSNMRTFIKFPYHYCIV